MGKQGFTGWYFKLQKEGQTVAFIPGRAGDGAFVQVLDCQGSRHFPLSRLQVENGVIRADSCRFSSAGLDIDLPGISGRVSFGPLTPLAAPIMGPFRFLPLQCSHRVISMSHSLSGSLCLDGRRLDLDGGRGYIEQDSGVSFPRSYLWLQCNDFAQPCSIMTAIAHIPLAGIGFTGCICALICRGREYRLATYRGVRILAGGPQRVALRQGPLRLELELTPQDKGHPLLSPQQGRMSGIIHESSRARLRARFWQRGELIFDLSSENASYEWV